jgi:hypothetical protein
MSKEVIETETNIPAQDSQHNAFEAFGAQATNRNIVGQLLKFTKGNWKAGMHNETIEEGTQLIVDMHTLTVGWQKWEDEKPVDNHMGLVSENYQPPRRTAIGDLEKEHWPEDRNGVKHDPWQTANMVLMRQIGTTGDEEGLYTFVSGSRGGTNAIGVISKLYGRNIRIDSEALPVVELSSDSYQHSDNRIGEVFIPVLKLIGWATATDVEDATETVITPVNESAAPKKDEAPKKDSAKAAAKPAPAKKAEAAKGGTKKKTRF